MQLTARGGLFLSPLRRGFFCFGDGRQAPEDLKREKLAERETFLEKGSPSPPRAPPFRARKLLQVVEMCSGTGGAMDAAVLDMKHCADLFLFSTTFPVNHLLPPDHKETQPFLPAVQRSADGSSNLRETTQPHTLIQPPEQPPHTLRLETPAGKACAVWRRLCRRGADS